MSHFLLFASLVLNVIALFCIIILYLRQNRFLHVEKKQEKMMAEMEDLISTYLVEMKEENELFIEKANKLQIKQRTEKIEKREEYDSVDIKSQLIQEEQTQIPQKELPFHEAVVDRSTFPKGNKFQAVQAYKNTVPIADDSHSNGTQELPSKVEKEPSLKEQQSERKQDSHRPSDSEMNSLPNQVFFLKNQGMKIEEIAKRLNKGKTEIELLLKFRQKGKE